jgi:hypothetical protein
MASYIEYEKNAADHEYNKIGGNSLLPASINWPADRHGNKMLFLASLSSHLLKSQCNIIIPEDHVLSIFCPYKNGDIEYAIDIARGRERGYVVAHLAGAPRQEFEYPITEAKKVELDEDLETDEDEFSEDLDDKIGGRPNWLQDTFDYAGYDFVMQISGMYFGKITPTHKDLLMSGMFYIFYNPHNNNGLVTLQYS